MNWFIGSHHVREEGDVLAVTFRGEFCLQEMKQFITALERVIESHGRYGGLFDMQRLDTISPEARRFAGKWPRHGACYGNACFGAGVTARTLAALILRAVKLFSGRTSPISFFKTEQDARAWLAVQRERVGKP